jgi:unspecific monooxygenase
MHATATSTHEVDLGDPTFLADPYPAYGALRASGVRWSDSAGAWLVADHQLVVEVSRSPLFVRATPHAAARDDTERTLQRVERADHTRLRSTVADVFHGEAARRLTAWIAGRADELVARCASGGAIDLMSELAHPLASHTIARILGLPRADLGTLVGWTGTIAAAMGPAPSPAARSGARDASEAVAAYVARLVAARFARPGCDLVSRLARDARLRRGEVQAMVRLLLFTGSHPMALAIGNSLDLLAAFPGQWEMLRRRPELLPRAVEECMRFEPVIHAASRRATTDVVIGGVRMRAGDAVVLLYGAANRDERVFARAEVFDVARQPVPHVAFGRGVHACLAPVLARMELRAVLERLLARDVTVRPAGQPIRLANLVMRGYERLPARLLAA